MGIFELCVMKMISLEWCREMSQQHWQVSHWIYLVCVGAVLRGTISEDQGHIMIWKQQYFACRFKQLF